MFYHLNELYGMTKCFDKFKIFSFSESIINGNICSLDEKKNYKIKYLIIILFKCRCSK